MMYVLVATLVVYQLFVHFLAVMSLRTARDLKTITPWGSRFGLAVLVIGYLADLVVQITVATVLFMELPRELTVSARVKRLIETGSGNRKAIAEWMRDNILKPFDQSGGHG